MLGRKQSKISHMENRIVACNQCRKNKQKCDGQKPCFRCLKKNRSCHYALKASEEEPIGRKLDAIMSLLHNFDERISVLESPNIMSNRGPRRVELTALSIDVPPIATVESLMSRSDDGNSPRTQRNDSAQSLLSLLKGLHRGEPWELDPITLGVVTFDEANSMIQLYFEYCHPKAPLLTREACGDLDTLRGKSVLLLLTILSVVARYSKDQVHQNFKERYMNLNLLLRHALSSLILNSEIEAKLESLEALQVYAHWMSIPLEGSLTNRSAWNIIGLALRMSKQMGLEHRVVQAFNGEKHPQKEDFRLLRVTLNLLSLDYQFMLSSRSPVTMDPTAIVSIARQFLLHENSDIEDIKLIALGELAMILHYAFDKTGRLGTLDWASLRQLNCRFDEWETNWKTMLAMNMPCDVDLSQIPFTSLRWYRIALNMLPIPRLLSLDLSPNVSDQAMECLNQCMTSSAEMLSCFLVDGNGKQLDRAEFKNWANYHINEELANSFQFSIDSYWISHAFSLTFLCFLYQKGIMNANCELSQDASNNIPLQDSFLMTLLDVGRKIVVESGPINIHPFESLKTSVSDVYDSVRHYTDVSEDTVAELLGFPAG